MLNDLERIGDHDEKIAILMERQEDNSCKLDTTAIKDIQTMADKTQGILESMKVLILNSEEDPVPKALERGRALDALRDKLRQKNLDRLVKQKAKPLPGVVFTDMLTSFEKMGDHAFNVVEACAGIR
ncbi:MAG: PhoU domain-containing protein [Elusimicrobiota bacterium]